MEKSHLVFVPSPGAGHLVSTIEFANRLLHHDNTFSVTILIVKSPFAPTQKLPNSSLPTTADTLNKATINYIMLPEASPPPIEAWSESIENYISVYMDSHKPQVSDAIKTLLGESERLVGIILDMFCSSMVDVATELGIPSYLFNTSSAAFLGLLLHLPRHYEQAGREFTKSDPEFTVSSFQNPVSPRLLPPFMLNKIGYIAFLKHARRFREMKGIIVNTFMELETYALQSFLDGQTPPVYPVGPVLDVKGQIHKKADQDQQPNGQLMTWLDAQPESSVVLLCFGSAGFLSEQQMREVAAGLQRSEFRFLWSLRKSASKDTIGFPTDYTAAELQEKLSEEFLSLLDEGRGMVCGWVPQVQVLAHKAIGGFVSHCGWNSILESLWFGQPIVTWPLYAEQQTNALQMVKELELAVEMRMDYTLGTAELVTADELACSIGKMMDKDNPVRKKVKDMADMSRKAVMDGGSSFKQLGSLMRDIKGNIL